MNISVIVASLDSGSTLERCISSVLQQTCPGIELIIIDGGSHDNTPEILEKYSDRIAYWHSKPDSGIYNALNQGIEHATGEWILVLGADDVLASFSILEEVLPSLSCAWPEYRIVYGQVLWVNQQGNELELVGQAWSEIRKKALHEMLIPHQGVFHHRSLFKSNGHFNERLKMAGDFEFLLREIKNRQPLFLGSRVITRMTIGGLSTGPQAMLIVANENSIARKINGIKGFSFALFRMKCLAQLWRILRFCCGERISNFCADLYRLSRGRPMIFNRLK